MFLSCQLLCLYQKSSCYNFLSKEKPMDSHNSKSNMVQRLVMKNTKSDVIQHMPIPYIALYLSKKRM